MTASFCWSCASGCPPSSRGSSSGGTGTTYSPGTCSGSRLVMITRTSGAARRTSRTSWAAGSSRCSQLSMRSRSRRSRRCGSRISIGLAPAWSLRSSAASTALFTRAASLTSPSSTNHAPSAKLRANSVPTRMASRVLPTPPGPTRLTTRAVASFCLISPSSRRRPTKVVASAGRLPDACLGLAILGARSHAGVLVSGLDYASNHQSRRCRAPGGLLHARQYERGASNPTGRGHLRRHPASPPDGQGVRGERDRS